MHLTAAAEYVEVLLVNAEESEGSGTLQTDGGSNIEAYFVAKGWGAAPGETLESFIPILEYIPLHI
jgi:hypothetical protein